MLWIFDQNRTGCAPHDRARKHFLELRASGFARAMEEDELVEIELPEEIARLFDLFVRRMAKVKATDDRTDRDMRHGTAEGLDGIHDSGMTATGHENAALRQQCLLFKNVITLGAALVAIERLAVVLAGRSLDPSGQIDALRNLAEPPPGPDVCRRQHGLSIRRHRKRMNGSVRMLAEAMWSIAFTEFRPEIRDGFCETFLQRNFWLPTIQKRVGKGDVRLALLRIVGGQRLVDKPRSRFRHLT